MGKYLAKRIIHSIISIIIVVMIVMILIYSLMDRQLIFKADPTYTNLGNNAKIVYQHRRWEEFGYIDYVPYTEWLAEEARAGRITEEEREKANGFARTAEKDSEFVAEYVKKYTDYYQSKGYTVRRLDAIMSNPRKVANGGAQQLFAYKDKPLIERLVSYFTGFITVDNIHYASGDVGERGIKFTLPDFKIGEAGFQNIKAEAHGQHKQ